VDRISRRSGSQRARSYRRKSADLTRETSQDRRTPRSDSRPCSRALAMSPSASMRLVSAAVSSALSMRRTSRPTISPMMLLSSG
jgi:hypothetical protein